MLTPEQQDLARQIAALYKQAGLPQPSAAGVRYYLDKGSAGIALLRKNLTNDSRTTFYAAAHPTPSALELPAPYSQRDPRWSSKHLAPSGLTMYTDGCVTTALAYQLTRFWKAVTPGSVCDYLSTNHGYTTPSENDPLGGLLIWDAVRRLTDGQVRYLGNADAPPAGTKFSLVKLIWGKLTHFVALLPDGACMEPWYGKILPLDQTYWQAVGRRHFG